jgi:serine/threonine-protein kinase
MPESENHAKLAPGADLSGKQLGDYSVLRRLGRGAMAEVYLAEQQSLGRQVAVKVLKAELASDPTCVQRFRREAQAAASLIHANIVQVHEVACIDGIHFIAQEYVQGANLQQYLARNGTLDLKLALLVLRQAAAALAKAAEQKIVHRDIKPENILVTKSGEVKVADFGLARVVQNEGAVQLTQAGMTMGTPLYMSPEQAEGKTLDHRSDIYSLGVACYQMLAGHPPFTGDTALAVAVQHLKKSPEPLENVRPDLPPALARIVHKMMAKSPDHRHQSARELVRELRPLLQEHLDEDLGDELPGLDTTGIDMATSIHAATQRLDAVMKVSSESRARWVRKTLYAAAAVAAFAVGGWVARATIIDRPLLEGVEQLREPIPRADSGAEQMEMAAFENTEEAWQSVIEYWPDDQYAVAHARMRLASIYLEQIYDHEADPTSAMEVLEILVLQAGDTEREQKAFGLAGQYLVFSHEGEWEKAKEALNELFPVYRELAAPQMPDGFYQRIEDDRANIGDEKADVFSRTSPPEEGGNDNGPRPEAN